MLHLSMNDTMLYYRVILNGQVIEKFKYFCEAWAYVYLDVPVFCIIAGPDGSTWKINPYYSN